MKNNSSKATISASSVPPPTDSRVRALERKVARLGRATAAFGHVAAALTTPVDLDRVLQAVLEHSPAVVGAERATLYLYDADEDVLFSRFSSGGRVGTIRVAVGQGIAGSVVQERRPIRVQDAYDDARFSSQWDKLTGFRTRAVLAVPMKNHRGDIVGVIQALNRKGGGAFTRDDELLFSSFATQAAISIENARLMEAYKENYQELQEARLSLERKVRELKFLFDLESAMAWAGSDRQLAESLLKLSIDATHARLAALLLVPNTGRRWQLFVLDRKHRKKVTSTSIKPSVEGLLTKTLRQRKVLRRSRLSKRTGELAELEQAGFEASRGIAAPLVGEGDDVLGVLALFDRMDDQPFAQEDAALLRLVAANVSTALVLIHSRESQRVSDRMSTIGRLLSGVMHDLKTPMAVISGYAQLLVDVASKQERRELADVILEQVSHMSAMQGEVLAFARGEKSLLVQKVYLARFFEEMKRQIEREIGDRNIRLEMRLHDHGVAWFDQTKMTRAVHNLARNALDAMGEKGVLTIDVARKHDEIVIKVTDTGPGIPSEVEERLFDSFVTVGKERGTGLGLAIVKKILEQHHGTIAVQSTKKGASFIMRLPQDEHRFTDTSEH